MEKLNPKKTMWLSLIPGLGQLKNGQKAKGIIFLGIFALFIIEMAVFGFNALVGLVTLGTVAGRDHSMFLMVRGTLQFLITIIFLMFPMLEMPKKQRKQSIEARTFLRLGRKWVLR